MPKGLDYIINLKDGDLSGAKKAKNEITGLDGSVETVTSNIGGMGSMITKVSGVLAGAFAVNGLLGMVDDITQVRGQFQGFENLLRNQLGPAGEQVFADIKDFSAKTPFEVDKLTESFIKLQGSGFNPTMEKMSALGDIAAAKMKGVDQLTEAIIDAQTGEFERLKEFGIRASRSGDDVTFTYNGMAKTMKFSQKNTEEYLLSLAKVEGVSGSMAAMSDTFIGKQSNVNDQIMQFKDRLGKDLEPVLGKFLDMKSQAIVLLQDGVDWFKQNKEVIGDVAIVVGSMAAAYGGYQLTLLAAQAPMAIMTAAQWAMNAAISANPVGLIVVGIGALIGGLVLAYKHSETFRAVLSGIGDVASATIPIFKGLGEIILGAFTLNPAMIAKGFKDSVDGVKNIIDNGGISGIFNKGFDQSMADSKKAEIENNKGTAADLITKPAGKGSGKTAPGAAVGSKGSGSDSTSVAGGKSVRNVHVEFKNLIERLEVHPTSLQSTSTSDIKRQLTELLVGVVHDSELALGSQ